ncbi:MAG TPA: hypothetical protein DDW94_11470 [Deltaproteobacteria bacterium]|nr:MAG: hypothetical protein A2Z79_05030 [Deltaproteobacteria bacterium GWA2_55_82]OGQ63857.1 MAG: hypothetical protein A3I81_12625 [Deltaproteobacteria bacterium RIFCSPLOWO2_02_FULL_55_12]OIJ72680.1 MAG: hypothetical protein A2V21_312600 [Deltaproteobacteria bacterium GWC2_55_46]HBG47590.1 hypothetical protein [Deltaproteobacteria bacterium]HCY10501.1 hypothetical protein [Deltaproteobacteria bacterium]
MIVYRKSEEEIETRHLAMEILRMAEGVKDGCTHEAATELMIELGRLESGIADSLFHERDGVNEISAAMRKASTAAGHVFRASWEGRGAEVSSWSDVLTAQLVSILSMPLPGRIKTRLPEGYAHYGLFPEVYLQAARDFFEDRRPAQAVCIGLRSIGTSLSSVVAATLESLGCDVMSFTLRPRGHPFSRKALLMPELEEVVTGLKGSFFLLVDEGPGLSGTSFSSVAQRLSRLGVPDGNIIIFPSWEPDGSSFISGEARQRWGRHARYVSYFEDIWVRSGRLQMETGLVGPLKDISAGMWRGFFYNDEDCPAVHPRHERRKYMVGEPGEAGSVMLKFAGHGRFGASKAARAARLSQAGFTMPVKGFTNGFILSDFVPGRPVTAKDVNQLLLDQMAGYLAFVKQNFPAQGRMSFDEFVQMAVRNITLGLGEDWAKPAARLEGFKGEYAGHEAVQIDGRMFPFEWLLTGKGYRKTDCLDHHLDQFVPSSQDIAWDLSMTAVEFEMNPMEQSYFVGRYSAAAGDHVSHERLRFYTIAYLAFRLGYSTFASIELAGSADGQRFTTLRHRYASALKRELLWLED